MKKAFIDPSGVLMAWGFVESNGTHTSVCVDDDFSLEPGKWQLFEGAWVAWPTTPPTPLQQIRALEQAHDDDQRKLTRISILELALDKVCLHPSMAGKTRAQVHTLYHAASRGYRELFELEVQIAALRSLIV